MRERDFDLFLTGLLEPALATDPGLDRDLEEPWSLPELSLFKRFVDFDTDLLRDLVCVLFISTLTRLFTISTFLGLDKDLVEDLSCLDKDLLNDLFCLDKDLLNDLFCPDKDLEKDLLCLELYLDLKLDLLPLVLRLSRDIDLDIE